TAIFGVSANCQIGTGYGVGLSDGEVLLWHGTALSMVDLTPLNAIRAHGYATTDTSQVGQVDFGNGPHAVVWQGTRESAVDLHPSWAEYSDANAVYGNQQVGRIGFFDQNDNFFVHATMSSGSAASLIDLNPTGFEHSFATGINSNMQVGGGDGHAMVWLGSADNYIDLHATLTGLSTTFDSSVATGIAENGDIIGYGTDQFGYHAIRWTRVLPEPSSMLALGLGALLVLRRRKKS
ncbi:MAG: PEP-CTERM sorting domain-containing protein, partial [Armatimonadota bacterium]